MENRILVIDDDRELCGLLEEYLVAEGFAVESVHTGPQGAEQGSQGNYALIVLDVMLPGLNGFDVLRRIRGESSVPVVMLTARGEEVDRIVGLEMGADDYLPKPFNPRELVARIRAIQRRQSTAQKDGTAAEAVLVVGDLVLDPGRRTVLQGERSVVLTSIEFSVLELLLAQAGRVISRDDICSQALGRQLNSFDRSIDVHVSSLRRKLGPAGDGSERIKSVRGIGYIYLRPAGSP
ncbi:response regulator [Trichlorobacter lovleyi]|uniref:Two component transcriptional regulator, winged helix family n=1 Tax=Trichlorobacter lovleyi (strain ATCC BAA-1151 / DSM 17278 / SZ) TaxID=398767 RepID=B3E9C2_TRIL1|nr:response regulator transcription factor [Trichlorobacter lovleyi]ACD93788.1 two component transcriptional regulator, winged helix family [Trichlorobacter lovleyi SZ]